jgi:HSP20 family protein
MPTVIRRSATVRLTTRGRELHHPVGWQVTTGIWSPPTDVYETDHEYVVSVEVAGMRDRDFEVVFENGILSVSGRRPDVTERRAYHQMEIHFGEFSTAVGIPGPVDVDRSVAEYADGFLIVRMPKGQRSTESKIEE